MSLKKRGILTDIVLFSYTMGVDTGEHLWYVLNFNTVIDTIVRIVIGLVVEKHGHV